MSIVFRPVRLLNRETIDIFRCLPVAEDDDGTRRADKRLLVHNRDITATATKNAEVLSEAFEQLTQAFAEGKRYRLIVPVNSYSMASKEGATLIVRAIKELDKSLRTAVIVEFVDLPRSLTLDMLGDITMPVLPFVDKYMAEPRPVSDSGDFVMYANCNYFGVSLNMESLHEEGAAAMGQMAEFWAEATKNRLKVIIQGINDQAIIDKAVRYEAFAIDGPLVGADQETLI